jgi:hypothetical protein
LFSIDPLWQNLLCILFVLIIQIIIIVASLATMVFALSPQSGHQEIRDDYFDCINLHDKKSTTCEAPFTDITAINYFSDGKTLKATVWLLFPFEEHPFNYTKVNYGMLIDSDFNKETGFDGIDYQIEISWDNHTRTWNKVFQQWSANGQLRILEKKPNYIGFFEKQGSYVLLSADLAIMDYPTKYKVIFYAESSKRDNSSRTDFSKWVAIPPPQLEISTLPNSLVLRQGEETTIDVQIKATQGFEPKVHFYNTNQSGIQSNLKFDNVRIPSYGIATTRLTIGASKNASVSQYTYVIFANATFPDEQFIKSIFPSSVKGEGINVTSTLTITILPPLTWQEQVKDVWDKLGSPITFFYGIAAGSVPWLFTLIKKIIKRGKQDKVS